MNETEQAKERDAGEEMREVIESPITINSLWHSRPMIKILSEMGNHRRV